MRPRILSRSRAARLVALVGNGLGQAGVAIAAGLAMKTAFDTLGSGTPGATETEGFKAAAALCGCALALGWLRWRETCDAEKLAQGYLAELRLALFDRLLGSPTRRLQGKRRGSMALRFVGELNALRLWLSLGFARVLVGGVSLLGATLALAWLSPGLLWGLLPVLGLAMLTAVCMGRSLYAQTRSARREVARFAGHVQERITVLAVIQHYGQGTRERQRLERMRGRVRETAELRAVSRGRLRALGEAGSLAAAAGVLVAALSTGVSAGVAAAIAVLGFLSPMLRDLTRAMEYWQGARASWERIAVWWAEADEVTMAPPAVVAGEVALNGVRLPGGSGVINARIGAGSRIALTGANGAGKSNLLNVIAGLVAPDAGQVCIDGTPIDGVWRQRLSGAVALASPDLPLLRGSLEFNLRYQKPDASAEETAWAWELCRIGELASALPDGLATKIVEEGRNLSLGQRQRVLLARALLARPRVLLLDELDSHMDGAGLRPLEQVLANYAGTVIYATHGAELLARADEVWRLVSGTLAERAPPGEKAPVPALSLVRTATHLKEVGS
ncbi:MAG: ABC transporter ATP-binding protein/permease [Pseudomonadota bacterium]|nr:ABC transporter ATP-binding protein [Gammaproteobacteria bacterium]MDQ3581123.1 ABC transporter ATP-binding protein/permease [Pseudomonadota bacterium]